jgi:hypothetical protein
MLPSLERLKLGDATGVTLNLVARPGGVLEDDARTGDNRRRQRQEQQPAAPLGPQRAPSVDETTSGLTQIIADLRANTDRRRTWRDKVIATMNLKIARYERRMEKVQVSIDEERAKIDDYMQAAYATPSGGMLPLTTRLTDPWDVAKDVNDRWRTLRTEKAAIGIVKSGAEKKKDVFDNATTAALLGDLARPLADALEQMMNDYPTQPALLETMRQLFVSFLANSTAASEYRSNFILMGNPGTGKTRMARSIAKVLGTMGIFVYDLPQEVYRSDFVADYEGQTAGKTRRLLEGNIEKVIFLDEAYMLTTWDKQKDPPMPTSYSSEATGELLTFLENNVGSTCFIAAGYEDKMLEDFLMSNPGLKRRFTQYIYIDDYKPEELERIYLDELARKMEDPPPEPARGGRAAPAASSTRGTLRRDDVRKWFTEGALKYLVEILTARSETRTTTMMVTNDDGDQVQEDVQEPVYPWLEEMFDPQAGAMVTLAAETKLLLAASGVPRAQLGVDNGRPTYAIGPEDMKKIIESRFLKSNRDAVEPVAELDRIACKEGWLFKGVWNVVDRQAAEERDCVDGSVGNKRRSSWFAPVIAGFGRG